MFLYGNINSLIKGFSDEKLLGLENVVKRERFVSNEFAYFYLFKDNYDLVVKNELCEQIFEKSNIFSSNNSAEIYYDLKESSYIFLCYKGDCFINKFAVELFENDELIYKGSFLYQRLFHRQKLKNDVLYTIKYYDSEIISDYYLSKVNKIYTGDHTDQSLKCLNWIENV